MEFPEAVLTKDKKGKLEVRSLDSRGRYVIFKYIDPKTMKPADTKRKLILKDANGRILEYFIISLRDPKRALLIAAESEDKEQPKVWNEEMWKTEEIWEAGNTEKTKG